MFARHVVVLMGIRIVMAGGALNAKVCRSKLDSNG